MHATPLTHKTRKTPRAQDPTPIAHARAALVKRAFGYAAEAKRVGAMDESADCFSQAVWLRDEATARDIRLLSAATRRMDGAEVQHA